MSIESKINHFKSFISCGLPKIDFLNQQLLQLCNKAINRKDFSNHNLWSNSKPVVFNSSPYRERDLIHYKDTPQNDWSLSDWACLAFWAGYTAGDIQTVFFVFPRFFKCLENEEFWNYPAVDSENFYNKFFKLKLDEIKDERSNLLLEMGGFLATINLVRQYSFFIQEWGNEYSNQFELDEYDEKLIHLAEQSGWTWCLSNI